MPTTLVTIDLYDREKTMKFGMNAPFRGPLARPDAIRTIARTAETLGFDTIIVSDHVVVPRQIDPNYPYSESGSFAWTENGETDCMEMFTLLPWLAAVTTTIRLMTSVAVIPHRNPLVMAKSIATADILSGGRVTLGCGTGWMREEFEALGLPPFDKRGQVTNEYIAAMKAAWTEDNPSFDGEFVKFSNIDLEPRPVQKPHPPVWIGGESMPALRRVVALGDGWYPIGRNPKFPLPTPAAYAERVKVLFGLAEQAGRDPATITLAYNASFPEPVERKGPDGKRLCMTGSAEQRAEDVEAYADIGVETMIVNFGTADLNAMLDGMSEFANNVMPLVSKAS
jgi:probable F420-dependent oxidoreductase